MSRKAELHPPVPLASFNPAIMAPFLAVDNKTTFQEGKRAKGVQYVTKDEMSSTLMSHMFMLPVLFAAKGNGGPFFRSAEDLLFRL
jgi:hypothetical protein